MSASPTEWVACTYKCLPLHSTDPGVLDTKYQVIILLRDAPKPWMIRSVYAGNVDQGHAAVEGGMVDASHSKRKGTGHSSRQWRWTSRRKARKVPCRRTPTITAPSIAQQDHDGWKSRLSLRLLEAWPEDQ